MLKFPQYTKTLGPQKVLYSEWHKEAIEKEISHQGVRFLSQKNPNRNNEDYKNKIETAQFWSKINTPAAASFASLFHLSQIFSFPSITNKTVISN